MTIRESAKKLAKLSQQERQEILWESQGCPDRHPFSTPGYHDDRAEMLEKKARELTNEIKRLLESAGKYRETAKKLREDTSVR